jgi:Ca2+-binding RTX toxin-like protein
MPLFSNLFVGTRGDNNIQTIFNPQGYKGGNLLWSVLAPEVPDMVIALGGNDIIYTGGGADTIFAGHGNDWMDAGPGNDVMWGGKGNDVFAFKAYYSPEGFVPSGGIGHGNRDKIMDFEQGADKIDVSYYHAWHSGSGEDLFIGKDTPDEFEYGFAVAYRHEGGSTIVTLMYNRDDGLVPATEIELRGVHEMTHSDFIFNAV